MERTRRRFRCRRLPSRAARWVLFAGVVGACVLLASSPARAQEAFPAAQEESPRRWYNLGSLPSAEDRAIWAILTLHVFHIDEGVSNDWMFGAVYGSGFAASFLTTHGPRAYAVGVERFWLHPGVERTTAGLGFRTGLVYGYDERLGWLAQKSPILPFWQPVIYGRHGRFTADLTYTWVVTSLTMGFTF